MQDSATTIKGWWNFLSSQTSPSYYCSQSLTQAPPTNSTHLLLEALLLLHKNVPSFFFPFTLRCLWVAVLTPLREMSRARLGASCGYLHCNFFLPKWEHCWHPGELVFHNITLTQSYTSKWRGGSQSDPRPQPACILKPVQAQPDGGDEWNLSPH